MRQQSNLMLSRITPRPQSRSASHSDPVPLENRRDRSNRTWIRHSEAKIKAAPAVASRSVDLAAGAHGKSAFVTGNVYHVRQHSAGAWQRTRSLARKQHLAHRIATNQHSIVFVADARELVRLGQQYRPAVQRHGIVAKFRGRDMLDDKTELPGCFYVVRRNIANPLDLNRVRPQLCAKGEFSEYLQLLRRIVAIDVKRRIRFREASGLRLAQRFLEVDAILGHARENVIAGPVENPAKFLDAVPDQARPQRSNDRNASANTAFESQADFLRFRCFHQSEPVQCKQLLVAADHMFAAGKRPFDEHFCLLYSCHE